MNGHLGCLAIVSPASPCQHHPAKLQALLCPGTTTLVQTHLWQSSPKPSRACITPVDDSPWVRNNRTGLCRARP